MIKNNNELVAIIAPESLPIPPNRGGGIQNGIWQTVPHFKKYQAFIYSACLDIADYPLRQEHFGHVFQKIKRESFYIKFLRFRYLQFNNYFPYVYQIVKELNIIKPKIVHIRSRAWFIPYLKRLLKYKPILILQHHNHYFELMKEKEVRYYLDYVSAFLGVSDFTVKAEVLNRLPQYSNKCFAVYNGIDLNLFKPKWHYNPLKLLEQRQKLGIKKDDFVIFFAGRLSKQKGILELIKAFKIISPKYPNSKLLIAGSSFFHLGADTDFTKQLKSEASLLQDKIIFTGYIETKKLPLYYAIADIFCGPSIFQEPFGQVFTEAMASGLPVIASRRGGIPEVVAENETALLIEKPENHLEIAEKLEIMIKDYDKYKQFGINGRTRVEQSFSWELTAKKTEAIYDQLIKEALDNRI